MDNRTFSQMMMEAEVEVEQLFADFDRQFHDNEYRAFERNQGVIDALMQIQQDAPVPSIDVEDMPLMPEIGEAPMPAIPDIDLGEEYPNG